jgi:hypothetical protein
MRDVGTFVAVASIGSDPDWKRYRVSASDWEKYAFGNLSQAAGDRREILQRILPTLKIANRCQLEDKFLVVRGDLRLYRIHIGSTNVLMEPGSRFLCIVPRLFEDDVSIKSKILLPFEGDRSLAVILSKAFLLANDADITDELIREQIRNG